MQVLIKIGFQLTDKTIGDLIKMLESQIKIVGESLLNSFYKVEIDNLQENNAYLRDVSQLQSYNEILSQRKRQLTSQRLLNQN